MEHFIKGLFYYIFYFALSFSVKKKTLVNESYQMFAMKRSCQSKLLNGTTENVNSINWTINRHTH